ncbi:MAG: BrnT family toxin [Candidatus Omnitrophica bacterium]|nr:BrnT family toxin [Candidatus Omnitrophota bacterium]MDE2009773.1 BrnT family toxin [Candidatus Omnitrophota bacterium]MDE2215118.1 BrnT family toxin [Candidatus Omnitrophota bacterium]MDE2231472.1 BrnT family toxin [Candidatus Omnitrophota bacterium]
MDEIRFDWDKSKAALNKKRHGISFDEAITIFYDDDALEFHDPDHSDREDRFLIVGLSFKTRILIVSHCVKEAGSAIRIISARKATKQEAQRYWEEKP